MKTKERKSREQKFTKGKREFKFKNLKLSTKIAVIASSMLIVVFSGFVLFTVLSLSRTLNGTIADGFSEQSRNTSNQIQAIIDNAASTAQSLEDYLTDAYKKGGTTQGTKEKSEIYNAEITSLSRDVEKFIIGTARSTVKNSQDVVGVGAFFEPYAFDSSIKDYTIYVGTEDADSGTVQSFGAYEEYSANEYYATARDTKSSFVTQPYDENGTLMISVSFPVIYEEKVQGVIMVDIAVSNFSKVENRNEKYPSMYTSIYNENNIIVYDTATGDITQPMKNFYAKEDEYNATVKKQAAGKAFAIDTTREDGSKISRYFQPIKCGTNTWWAMTALYKTEMQKEVTTITIWLLVISVFALAFIIGVLITILRRMLKPIGKVVEAAESIASGDLNIDIHSDAGDEIGQLSNSFNTTAQGLKMIINDAGRLLAEMANGNFDVHTQAEDRYVGDFSSLLASIRKINYQLSDTLSQINVASDQVSSGADQVSSGAQALSQGTTEQASAIEELAATINEISQHVKKTADNSTMASEYSTKSGEEVAICNEQMKTMVSSMADISNASNEIGKIIKTIEDIAFQTNILALNAAVEAARAGEAGKGFAVVADEVRNLASKSAEAASNTTVLIESAIDAVAGGTRIVDETASSMNKVIESSEQVSHLINDISSATVEQADSIQQITTGIDQISGVVQTNSATAEESAAASEELSGQSSLLRELVGRFTLRQ